MGVIPVFRGGKPRIVHAIVKYLAAYGFELFGCKLYSVALGQNMALSTNLLPYVDYILLRHRFILIAALLLLSSVVNARDIVIDNAWARASLPGQANSSVFLRLQNKRTESLMIISVQVAGVRRAEVHSHKMEGGMMRMREVPVLEVAAGAEQVFSPGGFHIMLFGLVEPLVEGDSVTLELSFDDDSALTFDAPVISVLDEHDYRDALHLKAYSAGSAH